MQYILIARQLSELVHRRGLGKVKHMHTQYLWVQERLKAGDFSAHKVRTDDSPADLFTKHLDRDKVDKFCKVLGYEDAEVANEMALRISSVQRTRKLERKVSKIRNHQDGHELDRSIQSLQKQLEKLVGR